MIDWGCSRSGWRTFRTIEKKWQGGKLKMQRLIWPPQKTFKSTAYFGAA